MSRTSEIVSDMYKFLSFISIFHKYDMFMRIGQNKINAGALNYQELSNKLINLRPRLQRQ
jgi:hypothetical protein